MFGDGAHIFLEDDLLRWGGTDDFTEPPEMGRAPGGPARIADILPQEKGFEAKFRGLEVADDIFTRPTQIPNGFIIDLGDVDGGEVARAHQPGQFDGISAVGFDPIPGFFGINEGATTQQTWPFFVRERYSQ